MTDVDVTNGRPTTAVSRERSPWWLLLGLGVGFLIPLFLCGFLIWVSIASLSSLSGGLANPAGLGGEPIAQRSGTGPAVAIVRVEGTITSSDDPDETLGASSGRVIADLRAAEADETVKAIVLRVNSPGGTVTGSAQIHEFIETLSKPVVTSMGATAASGGYYVSAPTDYIFARADTVTGSIGVILTIFDAREFLDNLGVEVVSFTSGSNKGLGNPWEEVTPEHADIFEAFIAESHEEFVRVVAEGRGLSAEVVRPLADGRIYTGRQALANGLVDELGNLDDAVQKAADLGGIVGEPARIEYERTPSFQELLLGANAQMQRSEADEVFTAVRELTAPLLEYRYYGR